MPKPASFVSHATPRGRESARGAAGRSFAAWLLLGLFVLVGAGNLIRGVLAFRTAPVHALVAWSIDPIVLGLVYVPWGLIFLASGIMFFRSRSPRARWIIRATALVYQITVWIIHLVGDRAAYVRDLWPRDLVITALFLAVVLLLTSQPVRRHRR